MKKINYIFIALLLTAIRGLAFVSAGDSLGEANAYVSFYAHRDSVKIYEDTTYLGMAPCDSVRLPSGTHIFKYIYGDRKSWLYSERIDTVRVESSGHIIRNIEFPFVYRISSEPYGAAVHIGDSVLGQTPFILSSNSPKNLIMLTKEGYADVTIPLESDQTFINVKLEPLGGSLMSNKERYLSVETSDNNFNIYLATGATVVTGVVSAYCKIKADSYYSDFQLTNDPSKLQKVRSFDTAAGISLAASEISLFLLSYLLLSR